MQHFCVYALILIIICALQSSLAIQQYEKPKIAIIQALSIEDESGNDEHQNLARDVKINCPENEGISFEEPNSKNEKRLLPLNVNNQRKDAYEYIRTDFQPTFNPYSGYEMYRINSPNDEQQMGIRFTNYDSGYPYTHTRILASYNRIPPVRYLPPVYPRIYGDILRNPRESDLEYFNFYERPQKTAPENDFLWEQLQHESTNDLRNVPYPYFRSATIDPQSVKPSYRTEFGATNSIESNACPHYQIGMPS